MFSLIAQVDWVTLQKNADFEAEQDYYLEVCHLESSLVLDVGKATSTADGKQQVLLWEHNWQDSQLMVLGRTEERHFEG